MSVWVTATTFPDAQLAMTKTTSIYDQCTATGVGVGVPLGVLLLWRRLGTLFGETIGGVLMRLRKLARRSMLVRSQVGGGEGTAMGWMELGNAQKHPQELPSLQSFTDLPMYGIDKRLPQVINIISISLHANSPPPTQCLIPFPNFPSLAISLATSIVCCIVTLAISHNRPTVSFAS